LGTAFVDYTRCIAFLAHRRLHVVVDAPGAGPLEQSERPVVGVEHHLLGLARIGPYEQRPAVAEPEVGDLHGHRHAAQQDDFVTSVELVGFTWREDQWNVDRGDGGTVLLGPSPDVAAHGIVAAIIATPAPQSPCHSSGFPVFTQFNLGSINGEAYGDRLRTLNIDLVKRHRARAGSSTIFRLPAAH
jgi:hypothetical protein